MVNSTDFLKTETQEISGNHIQILIPNFTSNSNNPTNHVFDYIFVQPLQKQETDGEAFLQVKLAERKHGSAATIELHNQQYNHSHK